jgi:hypothetical protein
LSYSLPDEEKVQIVAGQPVYRGIGIAPRENVLAPLGKSEESEGRDIKKHSVMIIGFSYGIWSFSFSSGNVAAK